mmetsp:Transcript_44767/g.124061  ORF Transcript_44767/g.124061 Transcript_44767/m.124061 type:complete len:202 (-) Transcript_44767:583-1188(-)
MSCEASRPDEALRCRPRSMALNMTLTLSNSHSRSPSPSAAASCSAAAAPPEHGASRKKRQKLRRSSDARPSKASTFAAFAPASCDKLRDKWSAYAQTPMWNTFQEKASNASGSKMVCINRSGGPTSVLNEAARPPRRGDKAPPLPSTWRRHKTVAPSLAAQRNASRRASKREASAPRPHSLGSMSWPSWLSISPKPASLSR